MVRCSSIAAQTLGFELGHLTVQTSHFELLFGYIEFGLGGFDVLRTCHIVRLQVEFPLIDAALLIERGLLCCDLRGACGTCLVGCDGCLLDRGFNLGDDLAFFDKIATVDQDPRTARWVTGLPSLTVKDGSITQSNVAAEACTVIRASPHSQGHPSSIAWCPLTP